MHGSLLSFIHNPHYIFLSFIESFTGAQLSDFTALLVDHCTSITEVMGLHLITAT